MDEHKEAGKFIEDSDRLLARKRRESFQAPLVRYALLAILLAACALGLSLAIETFLPSSGPGGRLPLQATASPVFIPEDYLDVPRPMRLEAGGQTQTAAVGASCWISAREGAQTQRTCTAFTGLPTPRQPLKIGSLASARLRSPFPATPQSLTLLILSLDPDTLPVAQNADRFVWQLKPGKVQILPAQPEPQFDLVLPDGLYALSLEAAWAELGSVNYGFLVQVDHALPSRATASLFPTAPPFPTVPPAPTEPFPTLPPAPTDARLATLAPGETAPPADPESAYATRQSLRQTAIPARATASPFPTAAPVSVQPGSPASAIVRRGGVSLQVTLAKDEFVAGEGGLAQITVRNDSSEALYFYGDGHNLVNLTLLDDKGAQTSTDWLYSWSIIMSGPPYIPKLEPGQQLNVERQFQIPPAEQNSASTYSLWIETRFSRVDPIQPGGSDNLWLRLESGPQVLKITPPQEANRLKVEFSANPSGWHFQVKATTGDTAPGPLWGEVTAKTSNAATISPLKVGPDGAASGVWPGGLFSGNKQLAAGGWVAAQGYVTATFAVIVPGQAGAEPLPAQASRSLQHKTFTTLEQAQASLADPLARLSGLPAGASLASVAVTWPSTDRMTIEQHIRLKDGQWLVLSQTLSNSSDGIVPWGQARNDIQAQPVTVNGEEAYLAQHNGWLRLDWRAGKTSFELSAPLGSLSPAELLALAAGVH